MKQKIVLTKLKVDSLQTLVEEPLDKNRETSGTMDPERDTYNNIRNAKEWRVWIDAAEMRIH